MKKLYIVYVHITPDGMYYYGVTSNIKKRLSGNGVFYKTTSLQTYIEKYGWENIQHKVLFENLSYDDALSIEDSLILSGWEKGNCINKKRSGHVKKEEGYNRKFYDKNKDKILERNKKYYEDNKNKIKQYYEDNKDKILEQQKKYYEKNREKKLEQNRQRYQRKKLEKQLKEVETTPLF